MPDDDELKRQRLIAEILLSAFEPEEVEALLVQPPTENESDEQSIEA